MNLVLSCIREETERLPAEAIASRGHTNPLFAQA